MDGKKVLEVISIYREYFEKMGYKKEDVPHNITPQDFVRERHPHSYEVRDLLLKEVTLAHCHGMLDEMEEFVAQGRLEKAFRWLGFVQGCLWSAGCYPLEDLKNHNRPDAVS